MLGTGDGRGTVNDIEVSRSDVREEGYLMNGAQDKAHGRDDAEYKAMTIFDRRFFDEMKIPCVKGRFQISGGPDVARIEAERFWV
jgi:hypothetical protein